VARLVDIQPLVCRALEGVPEVEDVKYPKLAEVTAWMLAHDLPKELQTAGWWDVQEEGTGRIHKLT